MKYLFIGGSRDGQRIDVTFDPVVQLIMQRQYENGEPLDVEVYQAMPFRGENAEFWVYVLDGMTADSLIQRLINAYPVPRVDKPIDLFKQ